MEQVANNKEIKKEINYQGVKKSKIIVARLIDFCFLVIFSIVTLLTSLFITVVTPGFNDILNKAEEIQLNSKLYQKDKNNNVYLLTEILAADEEMKMEQKNETLDAALTFFFSSPDFFKENDGVIYYNNLKKDALKDEKHLFILDGDKYIEDKTSGLTPNIYYDFYKETLNLKAFGFLQNNAQYHSLSKNVSIIFLSEVISMPILSYLILYFIVPLLSFKNHNTLGFKTFKIGIIDGKGTSLTTKKALGALSFSCLVVGILSLITFFIPLLISIGFFTYREDNKNLTGYLFDYYFIDISHQQIYENTEEFFKEENKVNKNVELYSNTPLEVEKEDKKDD